MMFLQNTNSNSARIIEDAAKVKDLTWKSLNDLLTKIIEHIPLIVAGLLVLLIFYLIARILKSLFLTASGKAKLDSRLRILFSRLIVVLTVIIGLFTALTVIIPGFTFGSLVTGLGFTTFVIGFATKDILNNLLSGVLILWQQPFRLGDYLFVGSNQGKVEYIGVRATQLRKDDGELVLIPNGDMYSSAITIRGAGKERRMLLKISISYDCEIEKAKEVIAAVLTRTEGVVEEPAPNAVVTDLTADGVNISIYFWINTDKNSPMQVFDLVASNIKTALEKAGIVIFSPNSVVLEPPKTPVAAEESASGNPETKKKKDDVF
jgi:small-conductance mechanosensitive channel